METRLRNEVLAARLNTVVSTCVQHSSNNVSIVNGVKQRVRAGEEGKMGLIISPGPSQLFA